MEIINFSKEDLNKIIYNDNLLVGSGGFGTVYRYNEKDVIKIDNVYVKNHFYLSDYELNKAILKRRKSYDFVLEDQQYLLNQKRANIKNTNIAKAMGYYNGTAIALISNFHDGYFDLADCNLSIEEKLDIFNRKVELFKELVDNYIYHYDAIFENNVLYRPSDKDVQLIDMDGPNLKVCEKRDQYYEAVFYEELRDEYNGLLKQLKRTKNMMRY